MSSRFLLAETRPIYDTRKMSRE